MALRAWRAGYRVVEIPITFTERRQGASKISRRIVGEALLRTAWWGLRGSRPAAPPPTSVAAARPGTAAHPQHRGGDPAEHAEAEPDGEAAEPATGPRHTAASARPAPAPPITSVG
jgi:apolipoprotein N-acyltransferase